MAQKTILRVVLASPGDVQAERDSVAAIIDRINKSIAKDRNVDLELWRWETDSRPGFHPKGPQGIIDDRFHIANCDILIGIFWGKFGTPIEKEGETGTEHEINTAIEAWRASGVARKPEPMIYFRTETPPGKSAKEIGQWLKVTEYREKFPAEGCYWTYSDPADFRDKLREHLEMLIRDKYPLDPR
jgi:hypothetical protein